MVHRSISLGLSTHHVLISRIGGREGVVSEIWQNMTRVDGCENLSSNRNGQKNVERRLKSKPHYRGEIFLIQKTVVHECCPLPTPN